MRGEQFTPGKYEVMIDIQYATKEIEKNSERGHYLFLNVIVVDIRYVETYHQENRIRGQIGKRLLVINICLRYKKTIFKAVDTA